MQAIKSNIILMGKNFLHLKYKDKKTDTFSIENIPVMNIFYKGMLFPVVSPFNVHSAPGKSCTKSSKN